MKLLLVFCLSAIFLTASEGQSKKAQPAPKVVKPLEIPKTAVESEPGTFRYTDAAGKKWIYRKTPFGVSRQEDKGTTAATASPEPAKTQSAESYRDVRAFEEGDQIRFEKPGPFGLSTWKTRKADLSEMERAVWAREKTAKKD